MSIAMVLGLIDGTASSEAALQAALQLGKRFSARVDLLHVEIDVASAVPVVGEGMSGAAVILLDPIFQGLAISLLFGLASSTALTVLVIPAIYVWLRDDGKPIS